VHDEFSYLLAADTFAHGRLTNPPHPMRNISRQFTSINYPRICPSTLRPQGAALAIGQVLGHPWVGVVLSVSIMCGAILWMLQGWMPARWALLGSIIIFLRLGIFQLLDRQLLGRSSAGDRWRTCDWCTARILKRHHAKDALLLGVGIAILANSRPYEGLILCLLLPDVFGLG